MTRTGISAEMEPRGVLIVTGTGTGVGKTVVTAAIAALALARGDRVAVVKPAQTGIADPPRRQAPDAEASDAEPPDAEPRDAEPPDAEPPDAEPPDAEPPDAEAPDAEPPDAEAPDAETVRRLSGVTDLHELARFPDPLSPEAAARVSGLPPLDLAAAAEHIAELADSRDLVLVEGAGGLLVRYDAAGATIADLAARLAAPVLVVTAAGLGTLNHTALTLEAIAARKLRLAGVVIGAWPRHPCLAERENLTDLATVAGGPLAGLLPAGSGSLSRAEFRAVALHGLGPSLGGSCGARDR
jgi:dethiobiotin synthetase